MKKSTPIVILDSFERKLAELLMNTQFTISSESLQELKLKITKLFETENPNFESLTKFRLQVLGEISGCKTSLLCQLRSNYESTPEYIAVVEFENQFEQFYWENMKRFDTLVKRCLQTRRFH